MLGWIIAGAAALGGLLLYQEGAFGSPSTAPQPKKTRITKDTWTGPKGLDLAVLQADEDEPGWDLLVFEYEMRGKTVETGAWVNGRLIKIVTFATKKEASTAAREMAASAKAEGRYASVRVRR